MRPFISVCTLALCLGPAATVLAAPDHEAQFRAADVDRSRGLSRSEVEAGLPRVLLKHFDSIDADGNGELSPEELIAMREEQAKARAARRAQRVQELQGGYDY